MENSEVAPSWKYYATRQTDMPGKTYHVRVTNVEDLIQGLPLSANLPSSVPSRIKLRSKVLYEKELAGSGYLDLGRLLYTSTVKSSNFVRGS